MQSIFDWNGKFVMHFMGEGADAFILDSAQDVIDYLRSDEGAAFGQYETEQETIEWLEDEDNHHLSESGDLLSISFDVGEISSGQIILVREGL